MKSMNKGARMTLHKETVKKLGARDLREAAGGQPRSGIPSCGFASACWTFCEAGCTMNGTCSASGCITMSGCSALVC